MIAPLVTTSVLTPDIIIVLSSDKLTICLGLIGRNVEEDEASGRAKNRIV